MDDSVVEPVQKEMFAVPWKSFGTTIFESAAQAAEITRVNNAMTAKIVLTKHPVFIESSSIAQINGRQ